MNSWRGRALSKAGKEVMIKSVLQAIPLYVMSLFILPSSLIDDIEKMLNAFWWGGGSHNNKEIHWLAWDRLTCPKAKGGLGFRKLEAFNMAMVAKQAWNIIQNPESLAAKLIKARYFPHSSLLEASLGYNPSYAWRSIWKAKQILLHGCRWRIGSGDRVCVMYDPWLRGKGPVVEEIIATPLISSVKEDKVIWEEERNGCYSVKSGYNLSMRCIFRSDRHHVEGNWNDIWKAQSPHKTRHLLWRLCRGCLPTRVRLTQHYVDCELSCPVCDDEVEDDIHVFFGCVAGRECWMAAGLSQLLENPAYQNGTVTDMVFGMCRNEDNAMLGRVSSLFCCIWHDRNDKICNDNVQSPSQVGRMTFAVWNEWFTIHQLRCQNIAPVADPRPVRWEKPGVGWIKCNVDAAFVAKSSITSMGICFRDTNGQFVAGLTQWQQSVYSIVEGEA
ncbi:hypothetical protein TSUD_358470 [Trifolium subterraneum]|uniref:Reverse transcriptase zinc-binding domain-containing protein n=1 Tax=Trifolium subterraneum TaxID=3900 RepID=A0A2Z6N9R3_TRISU|nr:hypothetical protein TSUD_358470 [Trifolium subterraneum]